MSSDRRFDISMHHVPVRGGLGALFLIVLLVGEMAIRLPPLRWHIGAALVVGTVLGLSLIWRRRSGLPEHPPSGPGTMLPGLTEPPTASFIGEDPRPQTDEERRRMRRVFDSQELGCVR